MKEKYLKAVKAYANGNPIMSDTDFDKLEKALEKEDPEFVKANHYQIEGVGKKVKLPKPMPGLKKVTKSNPTVPKSFGKPNTIIVSPKIDGCSALIRYHEGRPVQWFTRGRQGVGHDVSHLIQHANIPKAASRSPRFTGFVRFEIYILQSDFRKIQKTTEYKNAQRVATACITSKKPIHELSMLKFAALYLVDSDLTVAEAILGAKNFPHVPSYEILNAGDLSTHYASYRELHNIDTDGIVIMNPRANFEMSYDTEPDFAFAYKENVDGVHAKVIKIRYNESAFGKLTPVVEIEPTEIDGITITNVTAHNYENVVKQKIGPGAIVSIVRSGDVIPFIDGVIKSAKTHQDPDVEFVIKGVHAVVANKRVGYNAEQILRVATMLGVEGVGPVNASSLANFCNAKKIHPVKGFLIHREAFLKYAFTANQIANVKLPALNEVTPAQLAVASGLFEEGLGVKRAQKALYGESLGPVFDKVWKKGYDRFVAFYEWLTCNDLETVVQQMQSAPKAESRGSLVWSGYRDKEQEKLAEKRGFAVSNTVNRDTFAVFVNDLSKSSSKTQKAAKINVPVMLFASWSKTNLK